MKQGTGAKKINSSLSENEMPITIGYAEYLGSGMVELVYSCKLVNHMQYSVRNAT